VGKAPFDLNTVVVINPCLAPTGGALAVVSRAPVEKYGTLVYAVWLGGCGYELEVMAEHLRPAAPEEIAAWRAGLAERRPREHVCPAQDVRAADHDEAMLLTEEAGLSGTLPERVRCLIESHKAKRDAS
jgi:hypothetical protein